MKQNGSDEDEGHGDDEGRGEDVGIDEVDDLDELISRRIGEWQERVRSPLVLIPCDLERPSPGEPFRLRREDDDPVVNPTLRHRLRAVLASTPNRSAIAATLQPSTTSTSTISRRRRGVRRRSGAV